ncbi:MAG: hypothetical protein GWO00_07110 [Gemmatimonadetes bacterium]|nr:hypothetical protein [Gemmatimonadota bacterium]NIR78146.1 hypothetical protein [Gemmatimonadota bacterium]NIT86713.1 hypothetical protein [Gemmatimonadota bacterium]NIU30570.1 hypothetical protein [Gemmatimonadota bacterium]NIV60936.1 hypothetical protein [Gemmatimonadota bacterium]
MADPHEALLVVRRLRFVPALVGLPVLVPSLRLLPIRGVPLAAIADLVGTLVTTSILGLSLPLASTLVLASCLLLLPALISCLAVGLSSILVLAPGLVGRVTGTGTLPASRALALAPGLVAAPTLSSIVALVTVLTLSPGLVATLTLTSSPILTLTLGVVRPVVLALAPGLVVVPIPVALSVHAGGAPVPGPGGDWIPVAAVRVGGRARKAHPARILIPVTDPQGVVPALVPTVVPVLVLVLVPTFVRPPVGGAARRVGRPAA